MIGEAFDLGRIVATPGALNLCEEANVSPSSLIARHASGDWGDVPACDARENELSVREGFRILSSYDLSSEADGRTVWIITEASREVTTLLLPEEY